MSFGIDNAYDFAFGERRVARLCAEDGTGEYPRVEALEAFGLAVAKDERVHKVGASLGDCLREVVRLRAVVLLLAVVLLFFLERLGEAVALEVRLVAVLRVFVVARRADEAIGAALSGGSGLGGAGSRTKSWEACSCTIRS